MQNPFTRLLARLSVGRKLLLIYLLDLSAVIFISGILINEKFIAIDFARKELAGNAYIVALRQPLLTAADTNAPAIGTIGTASADAVRAAEVRFGDGMESHELNRAFAGSLERLDRGGQGNADGASLVAGRELLTRIGNKSNLILDPDLDSYYTMSLVLLRYPELLEVARDITEQMRTVVASGRPMTTGMQTRYFILEGRLDAASKGIESDFREAFAGSVDSRLEAALDPQRAQLLAAVEQFREAATAMLQPGAGAEQLGGVIATDAGLLRALDAAWGRSSDELNRLLDERIGGFFHRMWLHLGTALFLLCLILLAVFTVARHIAVPLKRLSGVAEAVGRSGDQTVRAEWRSSDEIGRLVKGFNDMLDQLAVVRSSEKELAASARAADAQRELVEAVPIPMVVTVVPTHEVLHANGPARAWLNGRTHDPWAEGLEPAVRSRFFQRLADEETVDEYEVRWHGGATPTWAVLSARRLVYQGREAVVTAFTPINHIKMLEQRLGLWAKVFEASSESIMIVDAQHRILSVNRAFCRSSSHDMRDVVGESPDILLGEALDESFDAYFPVADVRGSWQGEVLIRRRDRSTYPAWMVISAVREAAGTLTHYICASLDISERKASQERISFLAMHDALTALPNRSSCIERLRLAIAAADRSGEKVAVLFIDLDHFKTINDSLGHHVGDDLLRSVAQRLLGAVRAGDTVSRLGGDEFVVVLRGVSGSDEVLETVQHRLVPSVRMPHVIDGNELEVSCSVGVAIYPDDARDIDELMRHADVAMYHAKTLGRDAAQLFTSELSDRVQRKLQLQSHLRHALERREFSLVFQPKVKASNRALVGVEALLRWNSAELGSVSPGDFIGIAEESRLVVPIGAWVVDEALRRHAQWKRDGHGAIPVSINVSALQLRDGALADVFRGALRLHGVEPSAIELELTESTLMDGPDGTLRQLRALKALGIRLSVDDFGTGYSSLTYLHRFPVDRIKIDRSFIRNLLANPADFAITKAIVNLGHSLGLSITAEGVESEEVAAALRDADCDELQGYHVSPPLDADGVPLWIASRQESAVGALRLRLVAHDAGAA